ncbi:MAG: xdhA2 [Firmicutes bacterium]|nr:xdhA2 [Bacillota bacterium]
MTLRMLEDGGLLLTAGLHELGCGTITTMRQIIAEVMEVDPETIEAPDGDTQTSPFDSGCQASRTTFVCGACAMKAAESLKALLRQEASIILNCNPDQVLIKDGEVWSGIGTGQHYPYAAMACLIQQKNERELIVTETYKSQANPGSYGANFVEVEVDTFTGMVRVTEVVAVYDLGKAINPMLVEGQIHGAVQMGIGMAICEEITFDPATGRAKQEGFAKYHLINAPDMPPVKVLLIEKGEEHGPFGAKSIGEVAIVPTAAAVVNAINHALDTNLTVLPLTPERVLAGLHPAQFSGVAK